MTQGGETKTVGPADTKSLIDTPDPSPAPPADPDTGIQIGTLIGRFLVLYRLGSGGMGVVYAAFDRELLRRVALKVVRRRGSQDDWKVFSRVEAQAMARLNHSNTVTIYDVGIHGDRIYIAMEFVAGVTLDEWQRQRPRSWQSLLDVVTEAGKGLAAAHDSGLIHRDFKPSNVLVTDDGKVKVLDFGLAHLQDGQEEGLEFRGGTPGFMAPDASPSAATDQFSFCVTLFTCLAGTGQDGQDLAQDIESISRGAEPDQSWGATPRWLRRVIRRGLAQRSSDRFDSMHELLKRLSWRQRRRRHQRMAGSAFLLLATAIVASFGWSWPDVEPCEGAGRHWMPVWNEHRRVGLREVAEATHLPGATQAVRFVESAIDNYRADWIDAHNESCRSSLVHQDQSAKLYDLRMACLYDRLAEARAFLRMIETADNTVLLNAPRAADQLAPIEACNDLSELALVSPPPKHSMLQVNRVRAAVEAQRARLRVGEPVDLEALRDAADRAQAMDYPPLEAQALLVLGSTLDSVEGESLQAAEVLEHALWLAMASGDRAAQAEVAIRLMSLTSYHIKVPAESDTWEEIARASTAAVRDSVPALVVQFEAGLGYREWARGNMESARRHYYAALDVAAHEPSVPRPVVITVLNNAALAARPSESIEYLERAIALAGEYGESNPLLARPLLNLASRLNSEGRFDDALRMAERSLEINSASFGREQRENAYPLIGIGQIALHADRLQRALDNLQEGVDLAASGFGDQHLVTSTFRIELAEALYLAGDVVTATNLLKQVSSTIVAQSDGSPAKAAYVAVSSYVLAGQGRYREVLETLDAGVPDTELADKRAAFLIGLARAEAELGLGRDQHALASVDEALALSGPWSRPRLEAEAKFLKARVVRSSDPGLAFDLAADARASLTRTNPLQQKLAESIDRWLAKADPPAES
ncbi:MAG: serine/threonine-protein kinase [Acidobacteriota bacterium]